MSASNFLIRSLSYVSPSFSVFRRGYLANFWDKGTRLRSLPGHQHQHQIPFQYGGQRDKVSRLQLQLRTVSEIKRQRKFGINYQMSYPGGRKLIMRKILEGKKQLGESQIEWVNPIKH